MSVMVFITLYLAAALGNPVSIGEAVSSLRTSGSVVVAGERLCSGRLVSEFYERRGLQRAWNPATARDLVSVIRSAGDDGLDSSDYHLQAIESLRSSGSDELDLLLTDAFLLIGADLLTGRLDPKTVTPTWCLPRRAGDTVAALEEAVATGGVLRAIDGLRPQHRGYSDLRRELASLREQQHRGGWTPITTGPALRSGDHGEAVARLARRLQESEDLSSEEPQTEFDERLRDAVRFFQRRHGLDDDGVVGARTRAALNVPVERRIEDVVLNLERLRWLPDPGPRYAVINIAAFQLEIVEEDRTAMRMKIVVGKPFQTTPVFSSSITQIVFSPSWNVPESIARREIRPRLRRDPGYLARQHMQILPGGRIRQSPGPWNSLGLVKFVAPNDHGVYLHDTPARELFSRSSRAFSHGCMRLERPLDLAKYLLAPDAEWDRAAIEKAAAAGQERTVKVPEPLPMHVLYWTAWVDDHGTLQFRDDVYSRDPVLRAAMLQASRERQ